jgi:hypothetical protein
MRLRVFLLGVLIGLALAPAAGPETWQRLRDLLASAVDAALRIGIAPSDTARDQRHS